jgi:hypothetical protein
MNDNKTQAEQVADEMSRQMLRQLEHNTPAELGFPDMTADELVASEWRCWFEEEQRLNRLASDAL